MLASAGAARFRVTRFICEGVDIEDNVFIGHGVMFINDTYPQATNAQGELQTEADWRVDRTVVGKGASIGSNATILCNVRIGENAIVGAGSVVTRDVPANAVVAGNPAKVLRFLRDAEAGKAPEGVPFLDLITPHRELERETRRRFSSRAFAPQGLSAVRLSRALRTRSQHSRTAAMQSRSAVVRMHCVLPSCRVASSEAMWW